MLIVKESVEETARSLDLDETDAKEHLARAREILFEERKTRPAPHLDDKMVTAWNGNTMLYCLYTCPAVSGHGMEW